MSVDNQVGEGDGRGLTGAVPLTQRVLKAVSLQTGVELWSGAFGDDYTRRNQVEWRSRIAFWRKIIEQSTSARSAFEMGANAGWNLSAIRWINSDIIVRGNDINDQAAQQARDAGLDVQTRIDFPNIGGKAELVFTAGVLIHIEPEHVSEVMQALVDKSYRWVLAIEYAADIETQVEYRGHTEKCWKRPYGELYKALGLKLVESGDAGPGFDRCHYWLMEK